MSFKIKTSVVVFWLCLTIIAITFFQDLLLLVIMNICGPNFVQLFAATKELLILLLLSSTILILKNRSTRILKTKYELLAIYLFFSSFIVSLIIGAFSYSISGVILEARSLLMPLLYMYCGASFAELLNENRLQAKFIVLCSGMAIILAISGIVDYFFLSKNIWETIDIGSLETAKGYVVASGNLPDNFLGLFGRRALGFSFNPLLLSYSLIPFIFAFNQNGSKFKVLILLLAVLLTFSRLPIIGLIIGICYYHFGKKGVLIFASFAGIVYLLSIEAITPLMDDASAIGHFSTFDVGLKAFIANPFGYGIGSSGLTSIKSDGVYAESSVLNLLNQIGIQGGLLYFILILFCFNRNSPLNKICISTSLAFLFTSILSPQFFVVRASGFFMFLLGINKQYRSNLINAQILFTSKNKYRNQL